MATSLQQRSEAEIVKAGTVLIVCVAWAAPLVAQQNTQLPANAQQAAAPVIRVSSRLVVLDVLVKNKKTGAPIGISL